MNHLNLTWKDVLDEKLWAGSWDKAQAAVDAGYTYFVHNGIVYECGEAYGFRQVEPTILAKEIK